jgi:hypothetical protein
MRVTQRAQHEIRATAARAANHAEGSIEAALFSVNRHIAVLQRESADWQFWMSVRDNLLDSFLSRAQAFSVNKKIKTKTNWGRKWG